MHVCTSVCVIQIFIEEIKTEQSNCKGNKDLKRIDQESWREKRGRL